VADGTSLPELVDAPRCGLSVPQGDAAAIAAHIFHLMRHPAELAARGRAARALAEARHDSRRFAADLAALYREAAARRARG